jgi:hypothetical protein
LFLHNITCSFNKKINKHFNDNLGDINDIKFSLYRLLNFDPNKNSFKLCVYPRMNETILNTTFKFKIGLNM